MMVAAFSVYFKKLDSKEFRIRYLGTTALSDSTGIPYKGSALTGLHMKRLGIILCEVMLGAWETPPPLLSIIRKKVLSSAPFQWSTPSAILLFCCHRVGNGWVQDERLAMNKIVKLSGRKKWAAKGNLEVPEMEFTKFTVLSRARAVPPMQMLSVFG